ncbi:DNA-binding transcriptional MerR regulator [Catenulispora sp. EB89]|uniref:helix-turn-helix domain-containing protein n=1 Tax=Catenulispora sp. EB89 TaxID=3156257 RepID=UPI00351948EB
MNGDSATWTIDRLARLAAAALAAGAPIPPVPTQPNGRIREVPDVRTIRWYTSIGLLGRPAAMRGRTALYGRAHLAQLVAIKRLQAEGLTVAAVQERLLGADAAAIEDIAGLPADLDDLDGLAAQIEAAGEPATASSKPHREGAQTAARARFWATPATTSADEPSTLDAPAGSAVRATPARPARPARPTTPATPDAAPPAPVHGIRLAADVTLLLPPGRVPDAAARAAIAEAAEPLLALLDRLGLSEA